MPAVIGREARKGRLRAYTADGHDGKVWLSDDFVYASEKVGEEARGRGAARRHGPVLVSATAPGGGDQYVNAADPGQRPLVRRHAAPHVAAARRAVACGAASVADRTVNEKKQARWYEYSRRPPQTLRTTGSDEGIFIRTRLEKKRRGAWGAVAPQIQLSHDRQAPHKTLHQNKG